MVWAVTAIAGAVGASVATTAAVGIGVAGLGLSAYSAVEQKSAGEEAEAVSAAANQSSREEALRASKETLRLAEKAAGVSAETTIQAVEIKEKETAYTQSLAEARAAGSGVRKAGSVNIYLDALKEAGKDEIDWIKKVGASEEERILEEGKLQAANILGSVAGLSTYVAGNAWVGTLGQGIVAGTSDIYSAVQSAPTTPAPTPAPVINYGGR